MPPRKGVCKKGSPLRASGLRADFSHGATPGCGGVLFSAQLKAEWQPVLPSSKGARFPSRVLVLGDVEGSGYYLSGVLKNYGKFLNTTFTCLEKEGDERKVYMTAAQYHERGASAPLPRVLLNITLRWKVPGVVLVVVGDTVDRSDKTAYGYNANLSARPNDEVIVRALLALKKRTPSRVRLVAGNRELTKLRVLEVIQDVTYWMGYTRETVVYNMVAAKQEAAALDRAYEIAANEPAPATENARKELAAQQATRKRRSDMLKMEVKIQALLADPRANAAEIKQSKAAHARLAGVVSMGVPEYRDEDAPPDYSQAMLPGEWMFEYVTACELVVRLGNTLFVHGAITPDTLLAYPDGFVTDTPPMPPRPFCARFSYDQNVDGWIDRLNTWYRHVLHDCFAPLIADDAQLLLLAKHDDSRLKLGENAPFADAATRQAFLRRAEVAVLTDLALGDNITPRVRKPDGPLLRYVCNRNYRARFEDQGRGGRGTGEDRVKSVVTANNLAAIAAHLGNSDRTQDFRQMVETLLSAGIERVISGHKPLGHVPVPVVHLDAQNNVRFLLLSIDTTHSSCSQGRAYNDELRVVLTEKTVVYSGKTTTQKSGPDRGPEAGRAPDDVHDVGFAGTIELGTEVEIGTLVDVTDPAGNNARFILAAEAEGPSGKYDVVVSTDLGVLDTFACVNMFVKR